MSENWAADARVGVPMMQVIAKQVGQGRRRPREVRQIIDQQWLDEESKQRLRETYRVTDADLAAYERAAATEARRKTRELYGVPLDEAAKQRLRETFHVTDAGLPAGERKQAS